MCVLCFLLHILLLLTSVLMTWWVAPAPRLPALPAYFSLCVLVRLKCAVLFVPGLNTWTHILPAYVSGFSPLPTVWNLLFFKIFFGNLLCPVLSTACIWIMSLWFLESSAQNKASSQQYSNQRFSVSCFGSWAGSLCECPLSSAHQHLTWRPGKKFHLSTPPSEYCFLYFIKPISLVILSFVDLIKGKIFTMQQNQSFPNVMVIQTCCQKGKKQYLYTMKSIKQNSCQTLYPLVYICVNWLEVGQIYTFPPL